jgi:beta-galactosidase
MRKVILIVLLTAAASLSTIAVHARLNQARPGAATTATGVGQAAARTETGAASPRERVSLDAGWKFALGSASDLDRDFGFGAGEAWAKVTGGNGPVRSNFNDASWRDVDVPHDWAVELPFVQEPRSSELVSHGFKQLGRVFPDGSIGWYRKRFAVVKGDEGKRFSIEFDGAFRDCLVWLNGAFLGRHEGGYSAFAFDATDLMRTDGGDNLLTVRVDATQAEGWFYEGAGIYRHVWLVKTAPLHFPRYGVFAVPRLDGQRADVAVQTDVRNDSDRAETAVLETEIVDPAGHSVARLTEPGVAVEAWKSVTVRQSAAIAAPILWTLDHPALYRVVSTLRLGPGVVDRVMARVGIRSLRFDPDQGFFLNGQRVQINGVCNHQDHAGVGSAVPDGLQRFRLERLKEMGVNAYRTSHNPPAPELLDLCDELGILVMDETRLFGSSDLALEQLSTMVRRDRNHPSIILWSIGNEEPEQGTPRGNRIAGTMIRTVKGLDTSRPVTYASNSGEYAGVNELVDVRGFNYYLSEVDRYHKEHPQQPIVLSEIASTVSTRGEYVDDKAKGYLSAYDAHKPAWGELAEEWMTFAATRPWVAGGFVWTGFDYRGEPTPYEWPCISSHFGLLDTCGFPKDLFWYYKSWWTTEPVLHLLPHWNWPGREGQPIDVWAFTNLEEVRLSLNGRDLGTRRVERLGHAAWQVPYEPGRLEAVGLRGGREIARDVVETTGEPARIQLSAARPEIAADRNDVAVVTVSAIDDKARPVRIAANDVTFEIVGPGRIAGLGNGDPSSHEPDVFIVSSVTKRVEGWKMAPLTEEPGQVMTITQLEQHASKRIGVDVDANGMPPNSLWAFWTSFTASRQQIAAGMTSLIVGQVDDVGQIFLNGRLLGTTTDPQRNYTFDASALLQPGGNDLVILVHNKGGRGGLGRGVWISGGHSQAPIHRRLFNGLAQVLVQPNGAPGEFTLTATGEGLQPAKIAIRVRKP